jgi:hypothetical protein
MISIPQSEVIKNKDNLMMFLGGKTIKDSIIIRTFYENIINKQKIINHFEKENLNEGFGTGPRGLSKIVFLNRNLGENRIRNAFMIIESETDKSIVFSLKNLNEKYKIDKKISIPALRTITQVKKIDIKEIVDYLIVSEFIGFRRIKTYISKFKGKIDWKKISSFINKNLTHLAIPIRFRMNSKNTHLICFYSDIKFVPTNAFFIYKGLKNEEDNKILATYLNSICYLIQFYLFTKETTGGFLEIKGSDLELMYILDIQKLTNSEKQTLLKLFTKLRNVEFPSILKQLENRFWARVELDKTILKILGFSDRKINEWLPKVYDALVEELKAMKGVR